MLRPNISYMNNLKIGIFLLLSCFALSCSKSSDKANAGAGGNTNPAGATYFTNPLLATGPDPWVVQSGGNYYYTSTTGNNIKIYQTSKMSQLGKAPNQVVWTPPVTGDYKGDIWAPEIHQFNNKWYIYFAADNGNDTTHRVYVLEANGATPETSNWTLKGKLTPTTDRWAIDPTILQYKNNLYCIWAGWQGYNQPGVEQLYIARMKDPYTLDGDRILISQPTYAWEKNGAQINEGPEILTNSDGDVFLIYSASSCFTDDYCLGMLSLKNGGDPMNPSDWTKSANPVFTKNTSGGAFGPGHCSFFVSKDTKESWILYHANSLSGQGCGDTRSPRMQKFTFNPDGTPNFGSPVAIGNQRIPSGE
jgi:GH43 family beta-xylosidase